MTSDPSVTGPWARRDVMANVLCTLVGCALLLIAWQGSSNEVRFGRELPWILLGTTGVVVAVAGHAAWILAGRRALRRARRVLHNLEVVIPDVIIPEALADGSSPIDALEAIPGLRRYHRPDCLLTAGKAAGVAASRAEHEAAGRLPCGACRP